MFKQFKVKQIPRIREENKDSHKKEKGIKTQVQVTNMQNKKETKKDNDEQALRFLGTLFFWSNPDIDCIDNEGL